MKKFVLLLLGVLLCLTPIGCNQTPAETENSDSSLTVESAPIGEDASSWVEFPLGETQGYSVAISGLHGLPIKFHTDGFENVTIHIRAQDGVFSVKHNDVSFLSDLFGDAFTVSDTSSIHWEPYHFENGARGDFFAEGECFIDAVFYSAEHIVGYAVIKIYSKQPGAFYPTLTEAISYPPIDGGYQNISETYVFTQIENAKR